MTAKAKINPVMMKWARKYSGFTNGYEKQLPDDIKEKYKSWENGDSYPSWDQLRAVSKVYDIPTAFFFSECPADFNDLPEMIDYRRLDNDSIYKNKSPALINTIRKSQHRRDIYLDLLYELDKKTLKFDIPDLKKDKKVFADYIRKSLDVFLTTQKSEYNKSKHDNFLNRWKDVLNNKLGILIFESKDIELEEMRGLCIFHEEIPVIILNAKDSVDGRIFSLFHELTHLLLGKSAICSGDENNCEEIFCNAVAGEFLVPEDDLTNSENFLLKEKSLKRLCNIYGVGQQVMLKRLKDTNKISHEEYISFDRMSASPDSSDCSYLDNMINYNGKAYYSLVLDAYDSGIINSLEVSKFTDLGKNQIPELQEAFCGGEYD